MLKALFFVWWFFLPAGLANMAPIFAAKLPYFRDLSFPLDCYLTFRNKRLLGSHKTWRGLLSGMCIGILTASLQVLIYERIPLVRACVEIDYALVNPLLLGWLLATGALTGDALKSFLKRQRGIKPGKSWFPYDQIDYIVGGVLFTLFYIRLALWQYILLFLLWFSLHLLATALGYLLHLKDSPL